MRRDVEIADARAIGQRERDRRLLPALPAPGFEQVRDGAGAEGVALERARDGGGQFLRAVVVEQREQAGGVGAERFAARGEPLEAAWRSAGTASRRRSRALDGLAWRVAATRPATCASSSMVWPVS